MRVQLNVKIPMELRERLIALAKVENRPLSNLVETVLLRYLDQAEAPPEPPKKR